MKLSLNPTQVRGLGGLRSLDLAVRSRSHYPDCATSPKLECCYDSINPTPKLNNNLWVSEENQMMTCNSKTIVDRDINASRNILNRGMKFVPHAVQSETI